MHVQPSNRGYGANQKKCYQLALEKNADITIMVHPDYQYTPKLVPAMAALIASGLYDCGELGISHSRGRRAQRRYATLAVHFQPRSALLSRSLL